ncbi:MAG: hypothetical protein FJ148_19740 [Deltaproteobacteria bacterium]|nr:hypothetical protein [Deltaproteobacteria bacterium]
MRRSPSTLRRSACASALLAALALGACSAGKPSGAAPSAGKPSGAAPTVPTSKAFHHADSECREVAARETENVSPQTQASKAAIAIYWRCMTTHGYPPPTSATPAPAATPPAS